MNVRNYSHAYSHQVMGYESRPVVFYFGLSIIFHLVFLGALIFAPEHTPNRRLSSGVVNVRLVSLPGPGPAPGPAPKTVVQTKPEVPKPPPAPVAKPKPPAKKTAPIIKETPKKKPEIKEPPKTVSLAPRKPKKSLKKETFDRPKAIESAIDQVQKKVESATPDSVTSAIEKIKKKVAENESADGQRYRLSEGGKSSGGQAITAGGGGQKTIQLIDIYRVEVAFQVERHWAFSAQLAGDAKDLQASVVFKVLPNGEITDIRFTEKSNNEYLDDSAYRAVVKSNPVLPHPTGIVRPYIIVGIRFTPEGLR
jgi:colicin import membrane protein